MLLLNKIYLTIACIILAAVIRIPAVAQEQSPPQPSKRIACSVYFLRNKNLWIYDLQTGKDRQITQNKWIASYGVSHSGRQIAYIVFEEKKHLYTLYIYDSVENTVISLFAASLITSPSFSPSDDKVLFDAPSTTRVESKIHLLSNTYGSYVSHIWVMDLKSRKMTDLTPESPYFHGWPSWSTDGKRICYSMFEDPWWKMFNKTIDWEIYILDVKDYKQQHLKIGKGVCSHWVDGNKFTIPDGKAIKIYDIQAKRVVNEIAIEGKCRMDFSFGNSLDTVFYLTNCGVEGRNSLMMFDAKTQEKTWLVYEAEDPKYVQ
jgi:dipeptidyl aminopeptidase/acylaminoacyl peptidase